MLHRSLLFVLLSLVCGLGCEKSPPPAHSTQDRDADPVAVPDSPDFDDP
jgi:hypothetical protein